MGMKQSIIDWLENAPGPTEAEARRWRRVRWGLVGLAVLAEILLWYVLYRMDVRDPPFWLKYPTNWIFENIPAAQGHTNLAFTLREKMPYIFTIGFSFAHLVAAAIVFFNHERVPFFGVRRVLSFPLGRAVIHLFLLEVLFVSFLFWSYFFSSEISVTGDRTYMGYVPEIPIALMLVWVLMHGVIGAFLGQHLVLLRDLVLHARHR